MSVRNVELARMTSRLEAQRVLFAPTPGRLDLLRLHIIGETTYTSTVNVWRNHSIEPVLSLVGPYIAYGGWKAEFRLSDYDNTLSFAGHRPGDVELLWLDSSRYLDSSGLSERMDWLKARLTALRRMSTSPIVIATWLGGEERAALQEVVDSSPATYFADLQAACDDERVALLDARSAAIAGTPVSSRAQVLLARKLACHWLPGVLLPPIKAVALDLDNTLHGGVLGEDGIDGVRLEDGHLAFQRYLVSLRERGIFLALVSRNERADVQALFAARADYPLRWEDFSATEVSWGDKAEALSRIAASLRIGTDAVLFVDDNPGELMTVAAQLPGTHAVLAHTDPSLTLRATAHYPALWRWKSSVEDANRVRDLQANAAREILLAASGDVDTYFESLNATLTYRHDPVDQLRRLADLCVKTNQFNLALRRFNETEVADMMQRADCSVVSVQLSDKLADSGVIGVIIGRQQPGRLVVEELCISCRALGRQLEDSIVVQAVRAMPQFEQCDEIVFRVEHGPRNKPALEWLARLLSMTSSPQPGLHAVPRPKLQAFVRPRGLSIVNH